jgi:hypothetical protein
MSCDKARTIITDLFKSPEINDCIANVVDRGPRDDFKQELFVILLEYPCDKIVDTFDQGKIKYFTARVIVNLFYQKRNVFQKTYLSPNVEYNTEKVLHEEAQDLEHFGFRQLKEDLEDWILDGAKGLDAEMRKQEFPYYEELINAIKKHGSMAEASRQSGIELYNISRAIKRVREYLKKRL